VDEAVASLRKAPTLTSTKLAKAMSARLRIERAGRTAVWRMPRRNIAGRPRPSVDDDRRRRRRIEVAARAPTSQAPPAPKKPAVAFTTPVAQLDVRPGGASLVVMRDTEGNEYPNRGVFLEVVENERIVFTDAYVKAWEPSERPFMTLIATFEDEGGKTRYTARALHWTAEARKAHEEMGFHEGWGQCADQLAEVARKI